MIDICGSENVSIFVRWEYQVSNGSLVIKGAYAPMRARWRQSMTKRTLLGVAAILSTAIATPLLAQAVLQRSGTYASYRPNGDLEIASSTPSQPREVGAVGRGTADAMALAPSFRPPMAGKETTTRPWSAPVGHRQPRTADILTSTSISEYVLDQEDANVDRQIRGVCRGC
jgi:hypothetical protein